MAISLESIMQSLPAAQRREIEARTKELIAEELKLQDLRKAMGKTQVELAKTLDIGHDAISRVEKRADMLLSMLSEHVRGLGGELTLVAEFPNRAPVRITEFEALAPSKSGPKPTPKKSRAAPRKRRRAA